MLDTRVTMIHSSLESFFSDSIAVVLSKFISTFFSLILLNATASE